MTHLPDLPKMRIVAQLLGMLQTEGLHLPASLGVVSDAGSCVAKLSPPVVDHISDQCGNKRPGHLRPIWDNLVELGHLSARASKAVFGRASQLNFFFSLVEFLFSLPQSQARVLPDKHSTC